jgi:secreted PhoX family phosphatase
MAFSADGDLWMMCDITTSALNASNTGSGAVEKHKAMGTFGNNALFRIPTRGPEAGIPRCFATGPMECELTGFAFTPEGDAILLAVQHPGEYRGTRGEPGQPETETVEIALRDLAGRPFTQVRTVPVGSNFPSGRRGETPRPAVVVIRPKAG